MRSTWNLRQEDKWIDSVVAENVVQAKEEFEKKGYRGPSTIRKAGMMIQYNVVLKG